VRGTTGFGEEMEHVKKQWRNGGISAMGRARLPKDLDTFAKEKSSNRRKTTKASFQGGEGVRRRVELVKRKKDPDHRCEKKLRIRREHHQANEIPRKLSASMNWTAGGVGF